MEPRSGSKFAVAGLFSCDADCGALGVRSRLYALALALGAKVADMAQAAIAMDWTRGLGKAISIALAAQGGTAVANYSTMVAAVPQPVLEKSSPRFR